MYFVTYQTEDREAIGLLTPAQNQIIALQSAEIHYLKTATFPDTLLALIKQGPQGLEQVAKIQRTVASDQESPCLIGLVKVKLLAPLPRPPKTSFALVKIMQPTIYRNAMVNGIQKKILTQQAPWGPILSIKAHCSVSLLQAVGFPFCASV